MSHSADRDRFSTRHGNSESSESNIGPGSSAAYAPAPRVQRAEAHVEFDEPADLPPPPRIHVRAQTDPYAQPLPPQPGDYYVRAQTDPAYAQPLPPQPGDYYDYGRRSHRPSASYANVGGEKSHVYIASPAHDDSGRMPSIQQNYRPPRTHPDSHPSPYPEAYTTFTQMPDISHASTGQHKFARPSHRRRDHITKTSPGHGVGGDGDGGDIQTSAVQPAEAEPDTLNKIMICVYRNSKRRFIQREIWMMKPGHRDDKFSKTYDLRKNGIFLRALRTDTAFFKEIKWRYKHQLRGTFKRYLSFKTVSTVRVLAYGNNVFGLADIREKVFSPVFMRIYNDPHRSLMNLKDNPLDSKLEFNSWVGWFWLKRRAFVLDKKVDLAIELVEAYDPNRVLGGIAIALTIYFTLTITWLALGGDPSYVAGVMSFVLSILAVLVGLTGLYDWLDLGHMGGGKDFLILDEYEFEQIEKDGWGGRFG